MIGENLRRIRKSKYMSEAGLSRLSGVCQITICYIETGKTKYPRIETLQKLANALNVSFEELTK